MYLDKRNFLSECADLKEVAYQLRYVASSCGFDLTKMKTRDEFITKTCPQRSGVRQTQMRCDIEHLVVRQRTHFFLSLSLSFTVLLFRV